MSDDDVERPITIHQLGALEVKETGEETAKGPILTLKPTATVTSVREVALSFQPPLQLDLDHLIDQLKELSDEYLRTIGSDPEGTCGELGVVVGQVGWVTFGELAKGTLDDRHRDDVKGTEWWKIVATAILTLIGALILAAATGKLN